MPGVHAPYGAEDAIVGFYPSRLSVAPLPVKRATSACNHDGSVGAMEPRMLGRVGFVIFIRGSHGTAQIVDYHPLGAMSTTKTKLCQTPLNPHRILVRREWYELQPILQTRPREPIPHLPLRMLLTSRRHPNLNLTEPSRPLHRRHPNGPAIHRIPNQRSSLVTVVLVTHQPG